MTRRANFMRSTLSYIFEKKRPITRDFALLCHTTRTVIYNNDYLCGRYIGIIYSEKVRTWDLKEKQIFFT